MFLDSIRGRNIMNGIQVTEIIEFSVGDRAGCDHSILKLGEGEVVEVTTYYVKLRSHSGVEASVRRDDHTLRLIHRAEQPS